MNFNAIIINAMRAHLVDESISSHGPAKGVASYTMPAYHTHQPTFKADFKTLCFLCEISCSQPFLLARIPTKFIPS